MYVNMQRSRYGVHDIRTINGRFSDLYCPKQIALSDYKESLALSSLGSEAGCSAIF
jgi:hypothetical protein